MPRPGSDPAPAPAPGAGSGGPGAEPAWDEVTEALLAEGWRRPTAAHDAGAAVIGCAVYVEGRGEGRVLDFVKRKIGASAHTVR